MIKTKAPRVVRKKPAAEGSREMIKDKALTSPSPKEAPLQRLTARALLQSGLVGLWKERKDVRDSEAFARKLRESAHLRFRE